MLSSPPLSTNGVRPLLILQSCIITMLRCLYCTFSFFLPCHNTGRCTTPSACSTSSASSGRRTVNTFWAAQTKWTSECGRPTPQRNWEWWVSRVFFLPFFPKLMSHWLSHPEGCEICPPLMTHRPWERERWEAAVPCSQFHFSRLWSDLAGDWTHNLPDVRQTLDSWGSFKQ